MASYVYILSCENSKFYVGRTNDIGTRFLKHKLGQGAQWTRLHRPTSILDLVPDGPFQELVCTLQMMKTHGLDHVRGGPWCNLELSTWDRDQIQKLIEAETFQRHELEKPVVAQASAKSSLMELTVDTTAQNTFQRHGCAWEPEEIRQLFDSLQHCVPLGQIALLLRRKESAIRSFLSKKVREMHSNGLSQDEIIKETNLSAYDVTQALHNRIVDLQCYFASTT
jgi:hypothetical protein